MLWIKKNLAVLSILIIVIIIGVIGSMIISGTLFSAGVQQQKTPDSQVRLASCEVHEFDQNLTLDMTIIHVTDNELSVFPALRGSLKEADRNSAPVPDGSRLIRVFRADMDDYYRFVHVICGNMTPAECFPRPPVYEFNGQYYQFGCLELYYLETYVPTSAPPA